MQKKCFKCHQLKPIRLFYRHPSTKDGYLNKCKACAKKDVRRRYYDPEARPKIKEYERKRFEDAARKSNILIYQQRQRKLYPGKDKARHKVSNSKRDGKLEQKPCTVCGNENSQAHHTDYRRPLFVTWLCFKHHREAHKQLID